jgi:hypothetical protein
MGTQRTNEAVSGPPSHRRKETMPWARVDDNWWAHPKVMPLSLAAKGLWISALSWSCAQRTPVIPDVWFRSVIASETELEFSKRELLEAGLWKKTRSGIEIHDWNDYQSDAARKKAAGKMGGEASGETRRTLGKHENKNVEALSEAKKVLQRSKLRSKKSASHEAGPSRPIPSQPVPSQPIPSSSQSGDITQEAPDQAGHEDDDETPDQRIYDIADLIAKARTDKAKPRSRSAYKRSVLAAVLEEETEHIQDLISKYPKAPNDVIANAVDGQTHSLGMYEH